MTHAARLFATLLVLLLPSCAMSSLVVDGRTGAALETHTAAAMLAENDVVFLGENHLNDEGHRLQLELVELLHAQRPAMILSMEMFERDVQSYLDAYLAGSIDEPTFLEASRPWKNYARHYRPIVEYARRHGLPVLAANMPRELSGKVAKEGPEAVADDPHVAVETTAPKDAYFEKFAASMVPDESKRGEDWVFKYYQAQCYKDDTMAESIVVALHRALPTRALVVHLCGNFHSDYGYGTAARVLGRDPSLRIGIVSTQPMREVEAAHVKVGDERVADFVLAVPAQPSVGVTTTAGTLVHGPRKPAHGQGHAQPAAKTATKPASKPAGVPAVDPDARPALGFMPDYESAGGVAVEELREGGPAAKAGLRQHDVIVELAGEPVDDVRSYMAVLEQLEIGKPVDLVVERDGETVKLSVVVGQR